MSEALRPTGLNEHRCLVRDTLGLYGVVVTCATYVFVGQTNTVEKDIIQAVTHCVNLHPALSVIIEDAGSDRPHLSRVDTLDLGRQVEFLQSNGSKDDADNLHSLLEHAHDQVLDDWAIRPRWRVYVLLPPSFHERSSKFYVAFAYSHVLADGSSGLVFHRSLLQALRHCKRPSEPADVLNVIVQNKGELPRPLEQAVNLPLSWSFLVPVLAQESLPTWLTTWTGITESLESVWRGAEKRPFRSDVDEQIRTELRLKRIPANASRAVLNVCRQHDVRLTGFTAVVMAKVLSRSLRRRRLAVDEFLVPLPLHLRRCLPGSKEVIANYPSATTARITISSAKDDWSCESTPASLSHAEWSLASRITEQLAKAVITLADQPIALLKYITEMRKWTLEQAAKPSQTSFEVSNLGAVEIQLSGEDGQDYAITDVIFSQSANACGPPFNLNMASVKDGSIGLTFTWWRGMLGVQDEDVFMDEVADGLVDAFVAMGSAA